MRASLTRPALATIAATAALLGFAPGAAGQDVQLAPFGGQGYENPYYVVSPPGDPRVFVVEGAGTIRIVKDGVTQPTPFLDFTGAVRALNEDGCPECGLYSIAFAPDYAQSGLFYAYFTTDGPHPGSAYVQRLEELRRSPGDPDAADPNSRRLLFELSDGTGHQGGQLNFGPDGYLYLALGDGHVEEWGQDPTRVWGKLLRIDPRGSAPGQYSIPADNPFFDGAGPNADAAYASGLRNPYRFSFDRSSNDLVIPDVGQHNWEEINLVPEGELRGKNFGWACYEGVDPYESAPPSCTPPPAQTPPQFQYPHPMTGSSAITGGYVVRDPSLPSLLGRYVYTDSGDNGAGAIRSLRLHPGGASDDAPTGMVEPFVTSFGQDACGHVYVTSVVTDRVTRIEPTSGQLQCKLAPQVSADARLARRSLKRGGIALTVICDEDCDAAAQGSIRVKRKHRRRAFTIPVGEVQRHLQMNQAAELTLPLTKKGKRRLRKALAGRRRAVARYEVSATGGGGGTDVISGAQKQRR